jgi:hypothetical protein
MTFRVGAILKVSKEFVDSEHIEIVGHDPSPRHPSNSYPAWDYIWAPYNVEDDKCIGTDSFYITEKELERWIQ